MFNRGDGQDAINDYGGAGGNDVLMFADLLSDLLWFLHVGNYLVMTPLGDSDPVTVQNWFVNPVYQIEQIETSHGPTLAASHVGALVDALAGYYGQVPDQLELTIAKYAATTDCWD